MTHSLNSAHLVGQQVAHMKRLRLFYGIGKITLCLLILTMMGGGFWAGRISARGENINLELLSVVGVMSAVAVLAMILLSITRLEELHIQMKEDADKVKS